jgi:MoxR-like ATPase
MNLLSKNETPVEITDLLSKATTEVGKVIIGKDEIIRKFLLAIISGGHILIEDIPGVGKTTLAQALAKVLSLYFKRISFTPDVMPSDITGFNVLNRETSKLEFREGPVFTNILLADELNRGMGRSQSALLEAMEERKVTIDGVTRELPDPFFVIASQNPPWAVGTAPIPESQLDRFLIRLSIDYPSPEAEESILKAKHKKGEIPEINPIISPEDFKKLRQTAEEVFVDDKIFTYIAELAAAARSRESLLLGISPRASLHLLSLAKVSAMANGRMFVLPKDITYFFSDCMAHRLVLTPMAKAAGDTPESLSRVILAEVIPPKL